MFLLRLLTRAKGAGALPTPVDKEAEVRNPVRQIGVLGRTLQAVSSPAFEPRPLQVAQHWRPAAAHTTTL